MYDIAPLQLLFPEYTISSEMITGTDMYSTDGFASSYQVKLVFRRNGVEYTCFIHDKQIMGFPRRPDLDERILHWISSINPQQGHFVEPSSPQ
jgi:hypothetical protein